VQRNFDEHDADGPRNLLYAVMVACSTEARGRGVLVALGGEIHAARDVTKVHTESITCFAGRDGGPVGLVNKYGTKALRDRGWVQSLQYTALFQRGMEIGAAQDVT
jgi:L-asparaginase/Glu-tRNA(Gln) amidotransferase subunit D